MATDINVFTPKVKSSNQERVIFLLESDKKDLFQAICAKHNMTISQVLRNFVNNQINASQEGL